MMKILISFGILIAITIVIAFIAMVLASYLLSKINSTNDTEGCCTWDQVSSLADLHSTLSWIIALSAIWIVLGGIGMVCIGAGAVFLAPEALGTIAAGSLI